MIERIPHLVLRRAPLAAAALCSLLLAGCGGSSGANGHIRLASSTVSGALAPVAAAGVSEAPCGPAAAAAATRTVRVAAERIYELELASREVRADRRQVQGYAPLLRALAAGDQAAVLSAVTSLVYSHTHIVRLRVTRGNTVVADVGGPYIIAPVERPAARWGPDRGQIHVLRPGRPRLRKARDALHRLSAAAQAAAPRPSPSKG